MTKAYDAADILACLEAKTLAPHDIAQTFRTENSMIMSSRPEGHQTPQDGGGYAFYLHNHLIQARTLSDYYKLCRAMGISHDESI